MDAFDADVLIYATSPESIPGRRVRALFELVRDEPAEVAGIGSVLLVPETLTWPTRHGREAELAALEILLARLDLRPLDFATSVLAVALGAEYGLKAADAVHLATAVNAGAERFITNNRRDFSDEIVEIDVTYPEDLPTPKDDFSDE
jgi:predicted nucleic acid-binding protein